MIVDIKIEMSEIGSAWATANVDTLHGELKWILVKSEWRGRGHGSRPLKEIEAALEAYGMTSATLVADPIDASTAAACTGSRLVRWYVDLDAKGVGRW